MSQPIFKTPLAQAESMKQPLTTRQKWDKYFRHIGDGNPRTIDKYNKMIEEIESELPFETQEEHDKWLNMSSTWMGEPEWPALTEKVLKRGEKYDLKPEQVRELKNKFKGKDYAEAMKRWLGGEAYGDILNGVVPYENYDAFTMQNEPEDLEKLENEWGMK